MKKMLRIGVLSLLSSAILCFHPLESMNPKKMPTWQKKALGKKLKFKEREQKKLVNEEECKRTYALMTLLMMSIAQVAEVYNTIENNPPYIDTSKDRNDSKKLKPLENKLKNSTTSSIAKQLCNGKINESPIHYCLVTDNTHHSNDVPFGNNFSIDEDRFKENSAIIVPFNNSLTIGIKLNKNTNIEATLRNNVTGRSFTKMYTIDYSNIGIKNPLTLFKDLNKRVEDCPNSAYKGYCLKFVANKNMQTIHYTPKYPISTLIDRTYSSNKNLPSIHEFYRKSIDSLQLPEERHIEFEEKKGSSKYLFNLYGFTKYVAQSYIILEEMENKLEQLLVLSHETAHQQQYERTGFTRNPGEEIEYRSTINDDDDSNGDDNDKNSVVLHNDQAKEKIIQSNYELHADIVGALNAALLLDNPNAPLYFKEYLMRLVKKLPQQEQPLYEKKIIRCDQSNKYCYREHLNTQFRLELLIDLTKIMRDLMDYFKKNAYKIDN